METSTLSVAMAVSFKDSDVQLKLKIKLLDESKWSQKKPIVFPKTTCGGHLGTSQPQLN